MNKDHPDFVNFIKEKFYYDETSPSCLRYINDSYRGSNRNIVASKKDDTVGYLNPDGYWRIHLSNGKWVKGHHVVWCLFNGRIPKNYVVDHINRIASDNCISNLRIITGYENSRNKGLFKSNTSGKTGVKLNRKKYKDGYMEYWLAKVVNLDGKEVVKHFSIKKLGNDEAFHAACEWRDNMILELNKLGAGYTETHGK